LTRGNYARLKFIRGFSFIVTLGAIETTAVRDYNLFHIPDRGELGVGVGCGERYGLMTLNAFSFYRGKVRTDCYRTPGYDCV